MAEEKENLEDLEDLKEEDLEEGEEETAEESPEEESTSEKAPEGKKAKGPDWRAKANAFYAKYKEAKERIRELEGKTSQKSSSEPPKTEDETERLKKVEFMVSHPGISDEEYDHISITAQKYGISLDEAHTLEEPYLQYWREKVENEKKVPGPSSPSGGAEEESLSERFSKLSKEEKQEKWGEIASEAVARGKKKRTEI